MIVDILQMDLQWLRRWLEQRRGGNVARASGGRAPKPKMTPEAARLDHRQMLRFMALNAAVGVLIGVCVGAALIFLDIGGLGARIGRAANPVVPVLLVVMPIASLFGAAATASAILMMPYEKKFRDDDDDARGE
ncbi:helix-turn-helix domain-containing protein [Agrobacterium tumefaciens]|uniref:Uncharacterized protein n=1 Tax=Agrobacterium tumefaciens TaxID=358 RepID=A0A2L2LGZ3_AGRTU|nr:helix-turn-helix domain-containing protein [Agrobacterium tumefaciens]AVH43602.1 hypothetical protein At1D1609_35490 [Agrobacterium tumefaciens]NSY97547.1 helix-turn-helix domain-containing protein [Agrobacterium tumefaciens]NSZ03353.1 helix-turn-helix domain-containing protein [Agrobacterium tumefaciens]NSZ37601.1 helix-turn-helix domain-containing protein [Agrobacterium tumefaciens]NTB04043.1 helix-turn-helix domain-containing protein [Agrobacterium tumefaciens]